MNFRPLHTPNPAFPITTFSVFRFPSQRAWWAFLQMGKQHLSRESGTIFSKMLGCGKYGFSIIPDWLQYAFLANWKSVAEAETFFKSATFQVYQTKSIESFTLQMQSVQTHGTWNGVNPFPSNAQMRTHSIVGESQAVVALTRATIHTNRLIPFWRNVPKTHQAMTQSKGLIAAFGVGELPIVQQATVSIWENVEALKNFAYQKGYHKEVVKMTRRENWYNEDLFARFVPVAVSGTWNGQQLI